MSEFYSMDNGNDELEVGEGAGPGGFHETESFVVGDDFLNLYEDDSVEVSEDDIVQPAEDATEEAFTVPGSDADFITYNADDSNTVEVRETNWTEDKDPGKFIEYLGYKLSAIPRHSGNTIPGCERANAYIKSLDNEASQAMRKDFDGAIDEIKLEDMRKNMHSMSDRLENHIERLQKSAGQQSVKLISQGVCGQCKTASPVWLNPATETETCLSCNAENDTEGLQKTAGTPALNVFMTPFERACTSIIINATISGGRNIEDTYELMKNKYSFTPREELAFQQLIADHGYPVFKDRGLLNEPVDPASGDTIEWQTQYHA